MRYATLLFVYFFFCLSGKLSAQQLFTSQELKRDLDLLKQSLLNYHPNLFAYQSEQKFHESFEKVAQQLVNSMTENEFYSLIKPLVSNIKCSHTELYHSNSYLANKKHYTFPIEVEIIANKIYVTNSVIASIPKGIEITKIDGVDSHEVIQVLKQYISSDGNHDSGRTYWLNKNFFSIYNEILAKDITIHLTVSNKGKTQELSITPKQTVNNTKLAKPLISSRFETVNNEKEAVLTIRSFDHALLKASGIHFNKYIKEFFRQLNALQIDKLSIDLRDNTGGNDVLAIKLFSYISQQPFKFYETLHLYKRSKKHLPPLQKAFFWTKKTESRNLVTYQGHKGLKHINPNKNSFQGDLQVLINGGTMSAATHFTAKCHNTKRATILGSTSAGTYQHSNSGFLIYNVLPHSGLQLFIPAIHYQLYLPNKELITEAIEPDPNADPLVVTQ